MSHTLCKFRPPIVFADYDGVLHPDAVYRERGRIVLKYPGASLFQWVPLLEEALEPHPEVRIVLSTSWVRVVSFSGAKRRLSAALQARVIGATYHSKMYSRMEGLWATTDPFILMPRSEQIMRYVQRHGLTNWLAIDDDTMVWPDELRHKLVATDSELGLGQRSKLTELKQKLVVLASGPSKQTDSGWMRTRRAVQKRAAALLGADVAQYVLVHGKLYEAGDWSGQYLSALANSIEGCTFILQLLAALKAGQFVPVVMRRDPPDEEGAVEHSMLQFVGGRLYAIGSEGLQRFEILP